jgi:hypothetical protein
MYPIYTEARKISLVEELFKENDEATLVELEVKVSSNAINCDSINFFPLLVFFFNKEFLQN